MTLRHLLHVDSFGCLSNHGWNAFSANTVKRESTNHGFTGLSSNAVVCDVAVHVDVCAVVVLVVVVVIMVVVSAVVVLCVFCGCCVSIDMYPLSPISWFFIN